MVPNSRRPDEHRRSRIRPTARRRGSDVGRPSPSTTAIVDARRRRRVADHRVDDVDRGRGDRWTNRSGRRRRVDDDRGRRRSTPTPVDRGRRRARRPTSPIAVRRCVEIGRRRRRSPRSADGHRGRRRRSTRARPTPDADGRPTNATTSSSTCSPGIRAEATSSRRPTIDRRRPPSDSEPTTIAADAPDAPTGRCGRGGRVAVRPPRRRAHAADRGERPQAQAGAGRRAERGARRAAPQGAGRARRCCRHATSTSTRSPSAIDAELHRRGRRRRSVGRRPVGRPSSTSRRSADARSAPARSRSPSGWSTRCASASSAASPTATATTTRSPGASARSTASGRRSTSTSSSTTCSASPTAGPCSPACRAGAPVVLGASTPEHPACADCEDNALAGAWPPASRSRPATCSRRRTPGAAACSFPLTGNRPRRCGAPLTCRMTARAAGSPVAASSSASACCSCSSLVFGRAIARFYVDYLWHEALGRGDVFWGVIRAKVTLFVVFFLIVRW